LVLKAESIYYVGRQKASIGDFLIFMSEIFLFYRGRRYIDAMGRRISCILLPTGSGLLRQEEKKQGPHSSFELSFRTRPM
jgi:hypothetical protein